MKTATYLKILIVSLLFAVGLNVQAQTTLLFEDFEDSTLTYTTSVPEFSDGSGDFFGRIPPLTVGSFYVVNGFNDLSYFGMMDLDGEGASLPLTVTFSGIDITGYSNLNFSILLAEDDDGTNEDWDANDSVIIEYRIDGGAYQNLLAVRSSGGTNTAPAIDTNFDGTGDGTEITNTFAAFNSAISGTGSTLDIRITANLDSGDEDLSIDDVKIEGDIISGPALIITESGGSTDVTEGGATDSFDIELNTTPTGVVNFTVAGDAQVTISPTSFQLGGTGVPQTITVTAVDDLDIEGSHTGSITISATSSDTDYNGLIGNITAKVTDNDSAPVATNIIINEVDSDTPGTDALEFIELYDGGTGNTVLDGLVVVLFNGSDDQSYDAIDLDGQTTDANGFFVIGSASVANVDLAAFTTDGLQNGADAVALYVGDATDFPNDTTLATAAGFTLVDAVVYGTSDNDDTVLINALTPGQAQIDEDGNGDKDNESISRVPDGGTQLDTSTFVAQAPTPGDSNGSAPSPDGLTITESGGSTDVTEGGATDTFDVVLDTQPTDSVTVNLSTPTPFQVSFNTTSLTFTTSDWNSPQSVTVSAVDDGDAEGSHTTSIDISTTSVDANYDALIGSITANITDNEPTPTLLYDADFGTEEDGFPDHTSSSPPATGPASVDGGSATSPEGRWTVSYDTAPSTDSTANEFSVNGGVLRIQDWGDSDGRYESFTIDVSAINTISISATGVTVGSDVQNGASEFFEYFYTLDGGADIVTDVPLTGDNAGTAVDYSVVNLDVSTANSLTVGFNFLVNGAGDGYSISEFTVTESTAPAAPNPPTNVNAQAVSKSQIDVTWTANGAGDDVLIAYNTTNTFDAPVNNTTYAPGDPLGSNGTILGVFSSSPASHSGLCPDKLYYYRVWSVEGAVGSESYSSGAADFATTFTFDLDRSDFTDWTAVDVANPNENWFIGGAGFASANGFDGGATQSGAASEDWLISPVLDLGSVQNDTFEFGYTSDFLDSIVGLELKYSTDYNGGGTPADIAAATWVDFPGVNSDFDSNKSTAPFSETVRFDTSVDLSTITPDSSVYIAFVYTSTGDGLVANTARDWNLFDPVIRGDDPNNGTINLIPGSTTITEGTTTTLTIDLSPNPTGTVTVCVKGSDDGQIVEDGSGILDTKIDITTANDNTVLLTLLAVDNGNPDGDRDVVVSANVDGYQLEELTLTIQDDEAAPTPSPLVITEIMYNPSSDESDWEWVEIYNTSSSPIDLTGYVLDDDNGSEFSAANIASGIIAANSSAILFNASTSGISATDFEAAWGAGATLIGVSEWPALNNGGDTVAIWKSFASYSGDSSTQFNAEDAVVYDDAAPWPIDNGSGSIYLTGTISNTANDDGANWAISDVPSIGNSTPVFDIKQSGTGGGNSGSDVGSPTPDQPDILLSASPTSFSENGGTSTLTVSLSAEPVGGYPLTVTLSSADTGEVTVEANVTFNDSADFNSGLTATLTGVDDSDFDGDIIVSITGTATGYDEGTTEVTVTNDDPFQDPGNVYISQYYLDSSTFSSWIEICVPTGETVDFTGYTLAVWSDSDREGWKTGTGTPSATIDLSSLGNVTGAATFLISDGFAAQPSYAVTAGADITDFNLFFTGDDSVVLYSGSASTTNLVDAVSITSTDTATDISIVRTATGVGFDLTAGSSYADFPGIWSTETTANVDGANVADNIYLGTCDFGSAPAGFAGYIANQTGSGGTGETDDKNGDGIINRDSYVFDVQSDGTTTTGAGAGRPFSELFGNAFVDANATPTPDDLSDDRFGFVFEVPTTVPTDGEIEVSVSDTIGGTPTLLATYSGSTGTWTPANGGTVITDPDDANRVIIYDNQDVSVSTSRFMTFETVITP